ncbi:MAG: DNA-protecting protein DprA [Boseongicola sp.]|nr:MAG: DNA-protecting protein DprA [Boseongicola sp.]
MAKDFIPSTHPLTPPLTEEVWLDWLRLLRSRRVGVSTFYRLMNDQGSAAKALEILPEIATEAGVENYRTHAYDSALNEWRAAQMAGVIPVAYGSPEYPAHLRDIPDPPPILWTLGDISLLNNPAIALVGARNASSLGTRMARRLANDLGKEGFVIASGLARGIDTAAHLAALETGTIAVMAGGVDVTYPAENAVLAQEIQEKGLLISEMPVNTRPQARHFPRRNRIISGLAQAVVIVEAAAKSGSLITARNALDQGRDVLAVPGHPFDARAAGNNMLIRDGATLIRSATDVIETFSSTPDEIPAQASETLPKPSRTAAETRELHRQILDRLGTTPVPEDQVIRDLNGTANQIAPEILTLEVEGRIKRNAGGLLTRTN